MDNMHKTGHNESSGIDKDKIEHLLEHWIEHNEGHSESFRKWAGNIRDAGFEQAADAIIQAAGAMDESTTYLLEARRSLDPEGC